MSSAQDFRSLIPQPAGVKIAGPTARAHARARLKDGRARELFDQWSRLYAEPYHGVTVDGRGGISTQHIFAGSAAAMTIVRSTIGFKAR